MEHTETATKAIREENKEIDTESRVYELGYLITPALSEGEIPQETAGLKALIEKSGGVVISEQAPQHITLAYAMTRIENGKRETFETANFGSIKFEIGPRAVASLKHSLDENKNLLRYIIFKTVRENTRAEIKLPQIKIERRMGMTHRAPLRKKEESVPISEEALDRSIKELMVE